MEILVKSTQKCIGEFKKKKTVQKYSNSDKLTQK